MLELLKKLIQSAPAAAKGELECAKVIERFLKEREIEAVLDCWGQQRANISFSIGPQDGAGGTLLFASHLDVVPPGDDKWRFEPFGAAVEDGKVFGRGSADMKAGLTACLTAMLDILEEDVELKGKVIFAATAGEETDSCGAKRYVEQMDAAERSRLVGVVIPEPTDFEIVTAHRGILWLELETAGKTAHGSMPDMGVNAVMKMVKVLAEVQKLKLRCEIHPVLGDCSMSVNQIEGGKATNVIPDSCRAKADIRTVPGQNKEVIVKEFEDLFAKLQQEDEELKAKVSKVERYVPSMITDENCSFVRDFCSAVDIDETIAVKYTTDGPIFSETGAPIIVFGPGSSGTCHKPDEFVEIADVEKGRDYYRRIIKQFMT